MEELAAAAGVAVRTLYRLFGSRVALLREAGCAPAPDTRERILDAALELVGRQGLAELSMEGLADAAGVSRATLYRLFPGKSALFGALIRTYSPWEAIATVIEAMPDGHPEEVMPVVGHALADALEGRAELLLRIVLELLKGDPATFEGAQRSMARGLPHLVGYLSSQMEAGRLRRMHPIVAMQLMAGPIVIWLLTKPLAEPLVSSTGTGPEVVDEITRAWLRAMAPEVGGDGPSG
jgi:AcrR family transcriptional regulator